jgi:hypothetical protein
MQFLPIIKFPRNEISHINFSVAEQKLFNAVFLCIIQALFFNFFPKISVCKLHKEMWYIW